MPTPRAGFRCTRGSFFLAAFCQPNGCAAEPVIPHSGDLSACRNVPHGFECVLNCVVGYLDSGSPVCLRGTWTYAACKRVSSCSHVPQIANSLETVFKCIDAEEGVPCTHFACQARFRATGDLICRQGHFNRPQCKEMPCGSPPGVPNAFLDPCNGGVVSGAVCALRCKPGFIKTSDLLCVSGSYTSAACLKSSELALEQESLSVELRLNVPYQEWSSRAVMGVGVDSLHLMQEMAKAARVPVVQLVRRDTRPRTKMSMAIDFDVLPPYAVPLEGAETNLGITKGLFSVVSASTVLSRMEASLMNSSSPVSRLLRQAGAEGTVEVLSKSAGAPCREVPVVANSEDLAACAYSLSGQRCPLVCTDYHDGTGDLICVDGSWSKPRCLPWPCEAPRVNNAADHSHCAGTASQERCMLECMPGYVASGFLTCSLGSWNGGTCVPRSCHNAPLVPSGNPFVFAQCAGMFSDQKCALRCEPGAMPTGSGVLQCDLGNWRQLGSCVPAPCLYAPVVRNSATDLSGCAGMADGQECPFNCASGFQKKGTLSCVRGQFLTARCVPLHCVDAPVVQGRGSFVAAFRGVMWRSGAICEVDCGIGRELSNPVICSHGRWSSASCIPIGRVARGCLYSPLVPRAANVSHCAGARPNDACHITCERGYKLSNIPYCSNGIWTQATCEPQRCQNSPTVEHSAGMDACSGAEHGASCTLFCLPGYSPGGLPAFVPSLFTRKLPIEERLPSALENTRLVCNTGHWVGAHCLEVACDSVPPGLNHAINALSCVGTPSRSSCKLLCEVGYHNSADPMCVRGSWFISDSAKCREEPCLQAPVVPHSRGGELCINTMSGGTCTLECEDGYFSSGLLRCQRGVWLPMACQLQCKDPPSGVSGSFDDHSHCAGTPAGSYCKPKCLPGFRPVGELRCLSNGKWEIVNCYDFVGRMQKTTSLSLRLSGSFDQIDHDVAQREIAADSFRITTAKLLHVSRDLVSVFFKALDNEGGKSNQKEMLVQIPCNTCETVRRRLSELLERPRDYVSNLVRDFCSASCWKRAVKGRISSRSCLASCKRTDRLQLASVGDVAVMDSLLLFGHRSEQGDGLAIPPIETAKVTKYRQEFIL
eukprot:TRINITY_DN26995_c0_g1_i1.p1 TRINITY_DN26995_c0_g1~~TRINITY_DN26995_c0_g1_i1.p1  ORF type:complete len:1242 (+),score=121.20 TRINITY_DN26995_c0_g1_i1:413-3727(+)